MNSLNQFESSLYPAVAPFKVCKASLEVSHVSTSHKLQLIFSGERPIYEMNKVRFFQGNSLQSPS